MRSVNSPHGGTDKELWLNGLAEALQLAGIRARVGNKLP